MKISKALKSAGKNILTALTAQELEPMVGFTLNELIENGLITDVGNDTGEFFFKSATDGVDASYALINGKVIRVSETLHNNPEACETGDMRIIKGISNVEGAGLGKTYYRLARAAGYNLGDSTLTIAAEVVTSKKK